MEIEEIINRIKNNEPLTNCSARLASIEDKRVAVLEENQHTWIYPGALLAKINNTYYTIILD